MVDKARLWILTIVVLMLVPTAVLADQPIQPDYVTLVGGSAEPGGDAQELFFIPGQAQSQIRSHYYFEGRNSFPDYVGEKCQVGEYIVPIRYSYQWGNGERVFTQDYLKTSFDDNLPMFQWLDADWFLKGEADRPYDGYACKYAVDYQDPQANGRFTELTYPKNVNGGESVTIRGEYTVTKTGPFVLEAFINPDSQQPLAVVESSRSSCDGSYYWAGSDIRGVAGQTYEFAFTVRAPTDEGQYILQVHSWTDCWDDGGDEIHKVRSTINVNAAQCSYQDVVSDIGSAIGKLTVPLWNLYSPISQDVIEAYDCTVGELENYCGTTDTDKDGIPDGCDYCPQDKGVPQQLNGCHPCFGVDPQSEAGKTCYEENFEDYGVPDRLMPIVNPIQEQRSYCDDNTVVTENVYEFGNVENVGSNVCSSPEECLITGGQATCALAEDEVTLQDEQYVCSGDNVVLRRSYSDGTSDTNLYEECDNSCESGACVTQTTCSGIFCFGSERDAIAPENAECSTDNDCATGELCQTGLCQNPDDWCQIDADCEGSNVCLGGVCLAESEPQCSVDSECSGGESCVDGYCIAETSISDDLAGQPCEADAKVTCDTGGYVVTDKCVGGEYVPTGRTCEGSNAGSDSGVGSVPSLDFSQNRDVGIAVLIILGLVAGGLAYMYLGKPSKRRKKR